MDTTAMDGSTENPEVAMFVSTRSFKPEGLDIDLDETVNTENDGPDLVVNGYVYPKDLPLADEERHQWRDEDEIEEGPDEIYDDYESDANLVRARLSPEDRADAKEALQNVGQWSSDDFDIARTPEGGKLVFRSSHDEGTRTYNLSPSEMEAFENEL